MAAVSRDQTPKTLASEWTKGSFRPAYYLFGEDPPAMDLAVAALKKFIKPDAFNLDEFSGDADANAGAIVSACQTPPMFSSRRLVIVRNVKFGAAGRKIVAEYLRDPLVSTCLALVSPEKKPDTKDTLASAVRALGGVVVFKPLSTADAVARLRSEAQRAGFTLPQDAAEFMIEEAGSSWGILRSELEKVRLFIGDKKEASPEDVAACLGYNQEANPFDLPRRLQRRETAESLSLLRKLIREGTDPFRLLYQITQTVNKQLRAKRLVRAGVGQEQIFRQLRLNQYYDKDYLGMISRLRESRLIRDLRACLRAEVALKSQAWLDPGIELDQLILTLCGKATALPHDSD